jgi:hypothetical protein
MYIDPINISLEIIQLLLLIRYLYKFVIERGIDDYE